MLVCVFVSISVFGGLSKSSKSPLVEYYISYASRMFSYFLARDTPTAKDYLQADKPPKEMIVLRSSTVF